MVFCDIPDVQPGPFGACRTLWLLAWLLSHNADWGRGGSPEFPKRSPRPGRHWRRSRSAEPRMASPSAPGHHFGSHTAAGACRFRRHTSAHPALTRARHCATGRLIEPAWSASAPSCHPARTHGHMSTAPPTRRRQLVEELRKLARRAAQMPAPSVEASALPAQPANLLGRDIRL